MHHKRTNILSRIHGHRESSEFWMYTSSTPCTVVLGLLANILELSEFSSSLPAHTFSRKLTLDWWGMYFLAAPAGFFLWIEIWRASCCLLSSSALHCSIWGLEGLPLESSQLCYDSLLVPWSPWTIAKMPAYLCQLVAKSVRLMSFLQKHWQWFDIADEFINGNFGQVDSIRCSYDTINLALYEVR